MNHYNNNQIINKVKNIFNLINININNNNNKNNNNKNNNNKILHDIIKNDSRLLDIRCNGMLKTEDEALIPCRKLKTNIHTQLCMSCRPFSISNDYLFFTWDKRLLLVQHKIYLFLSYLKLKKIVINVYIIKKIIYKINKINNIKNN